jgi:hypothetical protein
MLGGAGKAQVLFTGDDAGAKDRPSSPKNDARPRPFAWLRAYLRRVPTRSSRSRSSRARLLVYTREGAAGVRQTPASLPFPRMAST